MLHRSKPSSARLLTIILSSLLATQVARGEPPPAPPAATPAATNPVSTAPLWATSKNLRGMLETWGYTMTDVGSGFYRLQIPRAQDKDGWAFNVDVGVNGDEETVWLSCELGGLPKDVSADRLLRILRGSAAVVPSAFSVTAVLDGKPVLNLGRSFPNRGATTVAVRAAVAQLTASVKSTHELWNPALWPAPAPTVPAATQTTSAAAAWATPQTLRRLIDPWGYSIIDEQNATYGLQLPKDNDGLNLVVDVSLSADQTNIRLGIELTELPEPAVADLLAGLLRKNAEIAPFSFQIVGAGRHRYLHLAILMPNRSDGATAIQATVPVLVARVKENRDVWAKKPSGP